MRCFFDLVGNNVTKSCGRGDAVTFAERSSMLVFGPFHFSWFLWPFGRRLRAQYRYKPSTEPPSGRDERQRACCKTFCSALLSAATRLSSASRSAPLLSHVSHLSDTLTLF
eukprot:373626_1